MCLTFASDAKHASITRVSFYFRCEMCLHNMHPPFASVDNNLDSQQFQLETEHRTKSNFHSNDHIFTHWGYFTQMTNENQFFSLKWPYFHTLRIFHTNNQWKLIFHSNDHIFTHWWYFTQMTNESQLFTQMTIFLYIEDISHKWPMKVKFSLNWPYFHTLMILLTILQKRAID
jgi:hypothetical protein